MLRDVDLCLKGENAALQEEIERMRRLLFGSGSGEKLEKGGWIVSEEEASAASEVQEQSQPESSKPAEKTKESGESRKPRLKVDQTRRAQHEMVPEEVQAEPERNTGVPLGGN